MVRASTLAAFAATALLLLAGCGGGEGSSEPQSSKPESTSTAAERKGGEESIEGFGEEAKGSDRQAILVAFSGELEALARKDYASVCSHLSETVHESLARFSRNGRKLSCQALLPALLSPSAAAIAREQANGTVTKVRVEGDQAFVVFEAPGAKLFQQTMVDEGGEWKMATVAASVLVPEVR